jgi:hypothetical protein
MYAPNSLRSKIWSFSLLQLYIIIIAYIVGNSSVRSSTLVKNKFGITEITESGHKLIA